MDEPDAFGLPPGGVPHESAWKAGTASSEMSYIVPAHTGNWGKRAHHALDLLRKGAIVELLEEGRVLGYLIPPRLPLSNEVIEALVRLAPPEDAAARRAQYRRMAASGQWHYDPLNNLLVALAPLPDLPRAAPEAEP